MFEAATRLNYYKRLDIQKEIVREAQHKEIGVRYGNKGFGKRPDVILYPKDVLEFVKQGATSFHASEELWSNPLNIVTGATKKDQDSLRIGWDLVIDIDCPWWKLAKLTAWLIIEALKEFKIKSISIKFSGNKGFHIGVPYEAFISPKIKETFFPEDARAIASFLLEHIKNNYITINKTQEILFKNKYKIRFESLLSTTGLSFEQLTIKECAKCGLPFDKDSFSGGLEYACMKCGNITKKTDDKGKEYIKCPVCGGIVRARKIPPKCRCGSTEFITKFNPLAIIEVDTILIAPRHLYRMSYSMHEKSGLVSLPFNPEEVLNFKKEMANPQTLKISPYKFLDRSKAVKGEAADLLIAAREFYKNKNRKRHSPSKNTSNIYRSQVFDEVSDAIPKRFFPPCIKKILNGLEDGRKRSVFILLNFLRCTGWGIKEAEELLNEWNKRNKEPLRDVFIKSQLNYHMNKKQRVLPPNCDNKMYYKDIGVCIPDEFCKRIKNPAQYTLLKSKTKRKTHRKPSTKK